MTIGAVGAYYSSRLSALEERVAGSEKTLKSDVAGAVGKLEERVSGIMKEVDAKNTGTKDAVDAKIVGLKEAADLKVRFQSAPTRVRACTCSRPSLSRVSPSPLAVQAQVTGSSRLLRHCRLRALHKRHWSLCRNKGKTLVQTRVHRRGMGIFACLVCSTRRVPRRVVDNAGFTGEGIFQGATRACFGGALCCMSSPYDDGAAGRAVSEGVGVQCCFSG